MNFGCTTVKKRVSKKFRQVQILFVRELETHMQPVSTLSKVICTYSAGLTNLVYLAIYGSRYT